MSNPTRFRNFGTARDSRSVAVRGCEYRRACRAALPNPRSYWPKTLRARKLGAQVECPRNFGPSRESTLPSRD